jgi:hypothetical protein
MYRPIQDALWCISEAVLRGEKALERVEHRDTDALCEVGDALAMINVEVTKALNAYAEQQQPLAHRRMPQCSAASCLDTAVAFLGADSQQVAAYCREHLRGTVAALGERRPWP